MTDLPVLHQREEPVAKAGGVVPTHREVCPNQFAPGRGDGNAGRQCFDRCNHSPARPVHGTAAGRSATLGECRKEASSWQNAAYRSYGHGHGLGQGPIVTTRLLAVVTRGGDEGPSTINPTLWRNVNMG